MKNKRNIILIIIGVAIVILGIIIYNNANTDFNIKSGDITTKDESNIEKIKYDMKITYHHRATDTGYATNYDWDLINTYNKRAYLINDYNVWGNEVNPIKKGHNYTVNIINLTDSDIEKLIELSNYESDYTLINEDSEYVVIEKDGKETYLNLSDFNFQYDNKK